MRPLLLDQLPAVLAEDPFLASFVGIFQDLADGVQEHAASVALLADPTVAPLPMVRYLASWLGAELASDLDEAHQRRVAGGFGGVLGSVGTSGGLHRMLVLLSGVPGDAVTVRDRGGVFPLGGGPPVDKRVEIRLPSSGPLAPARLLRLIGRMLPADVHARVELGGRAWAVRPGAGGRVTVTDEGPA